jgi:hypothetical protein
MHNEVEVVSLNRGVITQQLDLLFGDRQTVRKTKSCRKKSCRRKYRK